MCGRKDGPKGGGPVFDDDDGFDPGNWARSASQRSEKDYSRYPWRHRFAPLLALVLTGRPRSA